MARLFPWGETVSDTLFPPFLKRARFALCTASVLFQLLPKFLMDYCAGWGNRRNRDGTAASVLNIHLWGQGWRRSKICDFMSLRSHRHKAA